MDGGIGGFGGKHQFGGWQGSERNGRKANNCAPGRGAGIYEYRWDYSRREWPIEAVGTARAGNFRRDYDAWEALLLKVQRLSAQRGARQGARLALPVRGTVFVYLRGWIGALVLATARVSWDSAGAIYR